MELKNSKLKGMKRLLKCIAWFLICVALLDAVFVLGFPRQSLPPEGQPADAVVVLGAAPNSPAIHNRALKGLELYKTGQAKEIILTGGITSVRDESEAMNMARFLHKGEPILLPLTLEEHSANTFENLDNSKKLVPTANRIVIVSDTYHLPRSFLIAKRLGFTDVYWDSPDSGYYKFSELMWYYGREMVAIVAYIPKLVTR